MISAASAGERLSGAGSAADEDVAYDDCSSARTMKGLRSTSTFSAARRGAAGSAMVHTAPARKAPNISTIAVTGLLRATRTRSPFLTP
jgi:hypothetical protein